MVIEVEVYIKDIITCFMVSDYCGVPGMNMQQGFQQQRHRCGKCSWGTGWASPPAQTQGFGLRATQKLLVPRH